MRALTLTIAFMLFLSSQAGAGETVMVCKGDVYKKYLYKHLNPLIGSSSVQHKKDGRWIDWGDTCLSYSQIYQKDGLEMIECKLEVYDSGAKRQITSKILTTDDAELWSRIMLNLVTH
ncbi:hypothetical protein OAC63_04790 [Amylibacter sp.]|nr:hypothetical protein [Amylibacter sp.]